MESHIEGVTDLSLVNKINRNQNLLVSYLDRQFKTETHFNINDDKCTFIPKKDKYDGILKCYRTTQPTEKSLDEDYNKIKQLLLSRIS